MLLTNGVTWKEVEMAGMRNSGERRKAAVSPVAGGLVKRNPETGRFTEVQGSAGVEKSRPKSESAARVASEIRSEALKRLADR